MDCKHCGTALREDGSGYHHSADCPATASADYNLDVEEKQSLVDLMEFWLDHAKRASIMNTEMGDRQRKADMVRVSALRKVLARS